MFSVTHTQACMPTRAHTHGPRVGVDESKGGCFLQGINVFWQALHCLITNAVLSEEANILHCSYMLPICKALVYGILPKFNTMFTLFLRRSGFWPSSVFKKNNIFLEGTVVKWHRRQIVGVQTWRGRDRAQAPLGKVGVCDRESRALPFDQTQAFYCTV